MSAKRRSVVYIDASALVKLVLTEPESEALVGALAGTLDLITSVLGAVETQRAVLAASEDDALDERTEDMLQAVTLVGITEDIRRRAGRIRPASLRTVDAIHLATALSFGNELETMIVYDRRLFDAARAIGLGVLAPGADRLLDT